VEQLGWESRSEICPWKDDVEGTEADHLEGHIESVSKVLIVAVYRGVYIDMVHRSQLAGLVAGTRHLPEPRRTVSIRSEIYRHYKAALGIYDLDNPTHCTLDAGKDLDPSNMLAGRVQDVEPVYGTRTGIGVCLLPGPCPSKFSDEYVWSWPSCPSLEYIVTKEIRYCL
jgi:hypothetical protein